MKQIEIIALNRHKDNYIEMTYQFRFTLPALMGTTTNPAPGLDKVITSFSVEGYRLEETADQIPEYYILYTRTESAPENITLMVLKNSLISKYNVISTNINSFSATAFDIIAGQSWNGTSWS